MKRLALVAAMLVLSVAPTVAEGNPPKQTPEQRCAMEGAWASIIMGFRQLGTPLSELIQKSPGKRAMIMMAYDYPRYNTEEMRERAKEDFVIDVEKICFNALVSK
ncbi:hypothetical protein [Neorhizobium petrolearium]|uniref:hypothetical protein n=1 Tax=Neorhizobium petrolearium TaxID=515361 RepID=UPI003F164403